MVRVTARQDSGKNCLATDFASRHPDVLARPSGQCLGAAKASGPEIRALPSVSLVFFPVGHGSDELRVES